MRFRVIDKFRFRQRIRVPNKVEGRIKTRIPERKSQLQVAQSENDGNVHVGYKVL